MPRQPSLDLIVQLVDGGVGAYVLSAELLIAAPSLTMTPPWMGTTSPSTGRGSTGGSGLATTRPQEEGCMAMIVFSAAADEPTPISGLVRNVAQLTGPVRA